MVLKPVPLRQTRRETHEHGGQLLPGDGPVRGEGAVILAGHHARADGPVHRLGVPEALGNIREGQDASLPHAVTAPAFLKVAAMATSPLGMTKLYLPPPLSVSSRFGLDRSGQQAGSGRRAAPSADKKLLRSLWIIASDRDEELLPLTA